MADLRFTFTDSDRAKNVIIAATLTAIGAFYILTIRQGHDWGDDFSAYIHHAKNIIEGVKYDRIGYIPNPYYPIYGGEYPPVFPLLLSPVYYWFGLNLTAMKIEIILLFLAFLLSFYLFLKRELPFHYAWSVIAIIGFNPYFWDLKDQILSELPFIFIAYASLYFIYRVYEEKKSHRPLYALLAGAFIYLAYGTRAIGIVMLASLWVYDFIKTKRISRFALLTTSVSVPLMILQSLLMLGGKIYYDLLAFKPQVIYANLGLTLRDLYLIWENGFSDAFAIALFIVLLALAAIGYWSRVTYRVTIYEVFAALYLVSVIIYPLVMVRRYVIPVIPLFIFYVFVGIARAVPFRQKIFEQVTSSALIIAVLFSYAGKYSKEDFGPIRSGVGMETTKELFSFIKDSTEISDVFIFWKPRSLALFTGRRASVYNPETKDEELWSFIQTIDAGYIVIGRDDPERIRQFRSKHRNGLKLVFGNQDYQVYQIDAQYREKLMSAANNPHGLKRHLIGPR